MRTRKVRHDGWQALVLLCGCVHFSQQEARGGGGRAKFVWKGSQLNLTVAMQPLQMGEINAMVLNLLFEKKAFPLLF